MLAICSIVLSAMATRQQADSNLTEDRRSASASAPVDLEAPPPVDCQLEFLSVQILEILVLAVEAKVLGAMEFAEKHLQPAVGAFDSPSAMPVFSLNQSPQQLIPHSFGGLYFAKW